MEQRIIRELTLLVLMEELQKMIDTHEIPLNAKIGIIVDGKIRSVKALMAGTNPKTNEHSVLIEPLVGHEKTDQVIEFLDFILKKMDEQYNKKNDNSNDSKDDQN